jgi:Na+-driven multidrug efflux pump
VVREALHGSQHDYSRGPLGRAILLLAVPMVLEMAMESVFAVTDIFFVAHLGPAATAAVGLTESLLGAVYALAIGLSIAATPWSRAAWRAGPGGRVARRGAGGTALRRHRRRARAAGVLLAPRLLALMGATPDVLAIGVGYTRVMLGGEASIILLFRGERDLRGAGDPAVAMRTLILANG